MGRQSDGKAGNSGKANGKAKKPRADPPAKEVKKIAEKLEIDEIRPDRKISKRVRHDPNERRRG